MPTDRPMRKKKKQTTETDQQMIHISELSDIGFIIKNKNKAGDLCPTLFNV